jgi:hypothetical protein
MQSGSKLEICNLLSNSVLLVLLRLYNVRLHKVQLYLIRFDYVKLGCIWMGPASLGKYIKKIVHRLQSM